MSVQAGVWNFDGSPPDCSVLKAYSQRLARYGPDGESISIEGPLGILYRPNHRTQDSRSERQPYISALGNVVAWDGRLDNRKELITQLGESTGGLTTDVHVVSAAFDRWGAECFNRFTGDWAFTGWNPKAKVLTLAVDFMAIKHLFYYLHPDGIAWCNDLEALVLQSGDRFQLDEEYVAGYLARSFVPGHTPYKEIRSVGPGSFVEIRDGHAASTAYWKFSPRSRILYKKDTEYEEHFRYVIRQAVRRRLQSDAPILADLSGGLDSSSIVCMADEILASEGAETPRLDTYSHYDPGEPEGDDLHYLAIVEKKRGRQGHHVNISQSSSLLPPASGSFAVIPLALSNMGDLQSKRAEIVQNGGYKVWLCGIGGDELVGGVPDPRPELADLIVKAHFWQLVRRTAAWSLVKRRPWIHLVLRAAALLLPGRLQARLTQEGTLAPWLSTEFSASFRLSLRQLGPLDRYGFRLPSRQECARTITAMSRLMSWKSPGSIAEAEVRYPYLDQDFVQFLLSIPRDQIIRAGERRFLMRRALRGIVPDEILSRRTKGVAARRPLLGLANDWPKLNKLVGCSLAARCGYVDQEKLHAALSAAKAGQAPELPFLLRTLSFELWLQDAVARGVILLPPELLLQLRASRSSNSSSRSASKVAVNNGSANP